MRCRIWAFLTFVIAGQFPSTSNGQLQFNFAPAAGTPANVIAGFAAAGQRWSSLFDNNVTVNVNIAFSSLGSGILGSTGTGVLSSAPSYTTVRNALINSASSAADISSSGFLQPGPAINMLMNHTIQNGNSVVPYFDNNSVPTSNNTAIQVYRANAKALGLLGATATADGSITFSSNFAWDFDPSNGITAGQFDFVGVATHEIGHLMGFISNVDNISGSTAQSESVYRLAPLDLFRFSSRSINSANGGGLGVPDFTLDNTVKYFSLDGGSTPLANFSNGANSFGDGSQASHWKDNFGLGIMDPTAAPGELLSISQNDINALDVIGWHRVVAVPEPATYAMCALGLGLGLFVWFRRRKQQKAILDQIVPEQVV